MSIHAIKQYQAEVEKIIHFGGTKKETAIRNAFYNLLNEYAKSKGLMLVAEVTIKAPSGKNVTPDGTLKDSLRQDWGYWESKDEADRIDDEISRKFEKGYPSNNILFEDSIMAVLIQNGAEAMRVKVSDAQALDRLIMAFISFELPEVTSFRKAIELFKQDVPKVTDTLREMLEAQETENPTFVKARNKFLKLCQDSINPEVSKADVREMIIQHILTEDIFNTIFDETQFHRENNIAHQLEGVINTFFTGATKRTALSTLQHYSKTINAAAAGIADHHEKQKFLKVVYETFYKSYNPKAADRLGVVYTPNEIVKFMIERTDDLLYHYFHTFLHRKNVTILDPATGTGTYITELIDYLDLASLDHKYENEIFCNEVSILPYYISNLNIEYTYKQKTGKYKEFENIAFVDTLDNTASLKSDGKQYDLWGLGSENINRIRKQNENDISVIIGNPPYNANQQNENDNNKNRVYKYIDQRIKDTFIKYSTAQKTKVYDMYARFYRWAMDRLSKEGIICYITNSSFINSRTFDGFRKCVQQDFQKAYIVDLGGDVRANPKLSGTKHNVFGIQTGVAIMFLVKKPKHPNPAFADSKNQCEIYYSRRPEMETSSEKLHWLTSIKDIKDISFEPILPDKNNNWINLVDNDFDSLLPLCSKDVKSGKSKEAIFELFSTGINSGRDEWVMDFEESKLGMKMKFYIAEFLKVSKGGEMLMNIKWSRNIKAKLEKGRIEKFSPNKITSIYYRPFIKQYLYDSEIFVDERSNSKDVFGSDLNKQNNTIVITGPNSGKPFLSLVGDRVGDYHFVSAGASSQYLPIFRYDSNGNRLDNITDWGLEQFVKQYGKKGITKEAIFHYVYAVLHNPAYRQKYELNLKREFPRVPFYKDFRKWAAWGKALMDLHINYEEAKPYKLKEHNHTVKAEAKRQKETFNKVEEPVAMYTTNKAKLKADKLAGLIEIDELTFLSGIPAEAWEYKLGNRSALEWILDQYKEKKPTDPTIAEKFNTYKFSDYKAQVIDLLKRVCSVSVETMAIVREMEKTKA